MKISRIYEQHDKLRHTFYEFIGLLKIRDRTFRIIYSELQGIFALMGTNKIVSISYAVMLLLASYLWQAEFIPQQYFLFGFIWILVLCILALVKTFLVFGILFLIFYSLLRLVKKHKILLSAIILGIVVFLCYMHKLLNPAFTSGNLWMRHQFLVFVYPSPWMLHDLMVLFVLEITFYLIVFRYNIATLHATQPEEAEKNIITKYYRAKGAQTEKIVRIILLMLMPLLLTRTIVYRGFLLDTMYRFNVIIEGMPISIDNQQYQILQPNLEDCKYSNKQTGNNNFLSEQANIVCIMPKNIMRIGFANEYILIIQNNGLYRKIYCVNGKCVRNSINNQRLVKVLMAPRPDFFEMFSVIQSGEFQ